MSNYNVSYACVKDVRSCNRFQPSQVFIIFQAVEPACDTKRCPRTVSLLSDDTQTDYEILFRPFFYCASLLQFRLYM